MERGPGGGVESSLRSFRFQDRTSLIRAELTNPDEAAFTFLENGSVFAITHRDILVNQVLGHPLEGDIGNLYLRRLRTPELSGEDVDSEGFLGRDCSSDSVRLRLGREDRDEATVPTPSSGENAQAYRQAVISHFPVMGPRSDSAFRVADRWVSWEGRRDGLEYECTLQLDSDEPLWFWTVRIRNTTAEPQTLDVVFTQDLGLGAPAAVRTNELYTSQYIDHTVFEDEDYGYVICSRQNQQQGQVFPWILHGCLQRATGYLTDGFQFFGLSYKETNVPAALTRPDFPNQRYQYEFALPALESEAVELAAGAETEVTFCAVYQSDHPEATSEQDLEKIRTSEQVFNRLQRPLLDRTAPTTLLPTIGNLFTTAPLFPSQTLTTQDLDRYFGPERRHVETQDQTILSFFHGSEYHVVTKEKELQTERPHGHILRSGQSLSPDDDILSLTAWMYGAFMTHVAIGNTNFNKMLPISRNPLNVLKSSGMRIFVRTPAGYQLLSLPSAFEMGLNSARWVYKGPDFTVIVRVWTSMRDPACFLEIAVDGTEEREFLISTKVILGDLEFETSGLVIIDEENKRVELLPAPEELLSKRYPEARFFIVSSDAGKIERVGGDGLLFDDGRDRDHAFVVLQTKAVNRIALALTGNVSSGRRATALADEYARELYPYDTMQRESDGFWNGVLEQARLSADGQVSEIAKLNDTMRWYAHNALIHFTTPYGLEQYSGAAWGLRDVCQGPVEFLLATKHVGTIKTVLQIVYSHQLWQTGDWPQWFMFDRYRDIYAPDSHRDIVIWPIKVVCDYVEASDDLSILDEEIAYTDTETRNPTPWKASLFEHTLKQIDLMEQSCIPGTALISFGHGDWEDTLQPADPAVRHRWVSSWTVELMYQTLRRYQTVCQRAGKRDAAERLAAFCGRIEEDFNRYLIKEGVVAGLVDFRPEGIEYLLHPIDQRTGVQYRLLPMTRGMLSSLFTPTQMEEHLALILEHLLFPDGVRLMNRPMAYHGGTEGLFKRAETAANFGREIGLQYVHAHIRYVEAMTRIGRSEEAYHGLLTIIPISMQDVVPCALPRQSNAYFSSSDAAFADRYEALEQFDRIKGCEIGIKGGWRIYSSGPGMVIAELILNLLGLREYFADVLLDPVLPRYLDGLEFEWEYAGKRVRYRYHVEDEGFSPRAVVVNGVDVGEGRYADNPYRRGGALIAKARFLQALNRPENLVEIHI